MTDQPTTEEAASMYRSNHPDVWAAVKAWKKAQRRFSRQIEALRKQFDLGDRSAYTSDGFGSKKLAGFGLLSDDWREPPPGWRKVGGRSGTLLVPYRNKAKGNPDLMAAWDAIDRVPDLRSQWPGMPAHTGIFRQPGCHADKADEFMYVDWGEGHGPTTGVDQGIWEPVLRSEYYRLKEAGEFDHLTKRSES